MLDGIWNFKFYSSPDEVPDDFGVLPFTIVPEERGSLLLAEFRTRQQQYV